MTSRPERRVALAIGNNSYMSLRRLKNACADAQAISKITRAAGFKTTARSNLSRLEMGRAAGLFVNQLREGGVGLLWFSGHGLQVGGKNLLLPVDARTNSGIGLTEEGLCLDHLLERAASLKAKALVVFIDACRDNPFAYGMTRSAADPAASLSKPAHIPNGFMVIYSAGSNQVALDNLGPEDSSPHSLFARELIPALRLPGCPIDKAVRKARQEVQSKANAAGYSQVPAIYDQLDGPFVLFPEEPVSHHRLPDNAFDQTSGGFSAVPRPKRQTDPTDDIFSVVPGSRAVPWFLEQCVTLDSMHFEPASCATVEQCLAWWDHCPDNYMFLVHNDTQDVVGYINAMALDKETANGIRAGRIVDPAIDCENIFTMDLPGVYDLFICSLVIHRDYRGTPALRALTQAFLERLHELSRRDIYIRWLLADAFTIQGRQLCSHLGMTKLCDSDHNSQIYGFSMLPPEFVSVTAGQKKLHAAYTRKHRSLSR